MAKMIKEYDLTTIGGRLGEVAHLAGGPSSLARQADISQPTISRIVQGRDTTVSVLLRIFQVLKPHGVTLEWLLLGEGDPELFGNQPTSMGKRVNLHLYGSYQNEQEAPIDFDEYWFDSNISRCPKQCYAFRSNDNEITDIRKGSLTIADTSVIYGDGIYLIEMENVALIKRIQFLPTGEIMVRSDSSAYQDYTLKPEQKDLIKIIGRVVWWETH